MDTGWRPGNELEGELHAALQRGDGARYAELLRTARLYEPILDGADQAEPPPLEGDEVLVFTSPVTLFWVLGRRARGYTECDVDELRERGQDLVSRLMVNPGVPIGAMLSLGDIDDVAAGREALLPAQGMEDAVLDEVLAEVRRTCLFQLGADETGAKAALTRIVPNELEARLSHAVETLDFDSFLRGLLEGDVVALTGAPLAHERTDANAPQLRVLGGDTSPVVPIFSSEALLDQLVPEHPARFTLPFQAVVRRWPGDDHVLCFNPGTTTELTLPGNSVAELATALVEDDDTAR